MIWGHSKNHDEPPTAWDQAVVLPLSNPSEKSSQLGATYHLMTLRLGDAI